MDLHYFRKPNPDPHMSEKLDLEYKLSQNSEALETKNGAFDDDKEVLEGLYTSSRRFPSLR
jgi:hypothetical protein